MFEELMHSIWDEFSKLVFHAEIEVEPQTRATATAPLEPSALDYSGGTAEAPALGARTGRGRGWRPPSTTAVGARRSVGNGAGVVETVVKDEHDKIGRNDPCWCGSGKKYKKCHGAMRPRPGVHSGLQRARSRRVCRGARPRGRAALEAGAAQGNRGGAAVGDAEAGWRAADDRAGAALRGRPEGGGGRAVALIVRRWHWDRGRLAGRRGRDGLGLRAARPPDSQLAPLRGPRRGAAGGWLRERGGRGRITCTAWPTPHLPNPIAPRLAAVREQLSLLSDYL